jgi:DNA-binding transcriptional ArsR family regulator
MARAFNHPAAKDITLDGVLHALADPIRRGIVMKLSCGSSMNCNEACEEISPSTISFHHKVLRDAGLIRSEKMGVQVINTLRREELEKRFPGLLETIYKSHKASKKS